jgi:hypothetical protein
MQAGTTPMLQDVSQDRKDATWLAWCWVSASSPTRPLYNALVSKSSSLSGGDREYWWAGTLTVEDAAAPVHRVSIPSLLFLGGTMLDLFLLYMLMGFSSWLTFATAEYSGFKAELDNNKIGILIGFVLMLVAWPYGLYHNFDALAVPKDTNIAQDSEEDPYEGER